MLNGASYNDPRKFLQTHEYKNLTRWTKEIGERPAVKRGRMVNRASGRPDEQLRERHDASDFATKTQDKIDARGSPHRNPSKIKPTMPTSLLLRADEVFE